ncbi:MAG: hypothetical protein U0930_19865 [Pirellulales bacterium]
MFLIIATWKDKSDSIFLVGNDPNNRKIPNWIEVFHQLDTQADPCDAEIIYAKVSRSFILDRDGESYFLHDDKYPGELKSLKFSKNVASQWYQVLAQQAGLENFTPPEEDDPEADEELDYGSGKEYSREFESHGEFASDLDDADLDELEYEAETDDFYESDSKENKRDSGKDDLDDIPF